MVKICRLCLPRDTRRRGLQLLVARFRYLYYQRRLYFTQLATGTHFDIANRQNPIFFWFAMFATEEKRWKNRRSMVLKEALSFLAVVSVWVQLFQRRWRSKNTPFLPFHSLFLTLSSLCMPLKCSPMLAKMWSVGQGLTSKSHNKNCLAPSLLLLKLGFRQSFHKPNCETSYQFGRFGKKFSISSGEFILTKL